MTGQSLLNLMEMCDRELQLQSGEVDVVRGLVALNAAQDMFESMVAAEAELLGGADNALTLTASQEYSTFPTGLLRIDRIQYLDPTTSKPIWDIYNIKRTAGQVRGGWVWALISSVAAGKPRGYWTNGKKLWWRPVPDSSTDTVRIYGFNAAADITASGTFTYEDLMALPLAMLACKYMALGRGDALTDMASIGRETLGAAMDQLRGFNKDGAPEYVYSYPHST